MAQGRRTGADLEQQVQEDLVRLDAYRGQLTQLLQQHQVLAASRADHVRAREALEGLDRAGDSTDVLLPLGGEAYIHGRPDRTGPVFMGIGSGFVAEIDRPKAVELLAQRTKQIEEAGGELEGQMRQLEERIDLITRRVEALTARGAPPESGSPGDVGLD
ncbi:MAG TPA: prefoldin subunit alpha [Thermoplasmata archaeon]|nr:prefoldin subunit alpha [Thermoplasmata archaeon]